MITQPKTPEEVFYHNSGLYEDFVGQFWLWLQLPEDIHEEAEEYAWTIPEEGESERISSRFETRFADLLDVEALKSPECQWLEARGIPFTLDCGYYGKEDKVLLWLNGHEAKRDAMLFKLTFGGEA